MITYNVMEHAGEVCYAFDNDETGTRIVVNDEDLRELSHIVYKIIALTDLPEPLRGVQS